MQSTTAADVSSPGEWRVLFAARCFLCGNRSFMFSITGWFETDLTRRHQPPFDINGTEFRH
jgi:hypothetical protein